MHSLAATRGRGTWAGEAAVSAKARVPRPMEYRIGFMFAFIFSCSFDHPCEDAYFDFYFVQPEKTRQRRAALNQKLGDASKPPVDRLARKKIEGFDLVGVSGRDEERR
jgi:hypothetical protein